MRAVWRWCIAPWTELPKTQRPRSERFGRVKDYEEARYDTVRWGARVLVVAGPLVLVVWLVIRTIGAVN